MLCARSVRFEDGPNERVEGVEINRDFELAVDVRDVQRWTEEPLIADEEVRRTEYATSLALVPIVANQTLIIEGRSI